VHYRSKLGMDYKQFLPTKPRKLRKQRHFVLLAATSFIVLTIVGAVIANVSSPENKHSTAENKETSSTDTIQLSLANRPGSSNEVKYSNTKPNSNTVSNDPINQPQTLIDTNKNDIADTENVSASESNNNLETVTITIKSGDTLSSIFSKRKLNTELHKIMQLGSKVKELKSVYPGQKIYLHLHDENLVGLDLETTVNRQLKILKQNDSYLVDEVVRDFEIRTQVASSTIENSLFLAGQNAGLSDSVIMELANIFGWDIDFALDIRTGDQFSVVYEEKYLDGEKIKDGDIIAAEFINAGESYRAVRYTDSKGNTDYYSQNGRSMRKPFLRTPVDFARISSRFNLKRKHPILNKIRAHKGVDYAASTGTPIKSSGDGKVVHRGKKGGYGRTIIVKHGSRYSTLYAHMHKYAKNTQVGKRVKQGQIIGYVGKSGLATGPHLHYEFRVNGVHRNPLTVKLPDAAPLPKSEMQRFKSATAEQFARLDLYTSAVLAQNQHLSQ